MKRPGITRLTRSNEQDFVATLSGDKVARVPLMMLGKHENEETIRTLDRSDMNDANNCAVNVLISDSIKCCG